MKTKRVFNAAEEGRRLLELFPDEKVFFNGKIVKLSKVPSVLPHALFYGACAWGGAMARMAINGSPHIFAANAHAERLIESAIELGITHSEMNFGVKEIVDAMHAIGDETLWKKHYMRPFIFRNGNAYGISVPEDDPVIYGAMALPFKMLYDGPVRVLINTERMRPSNPYAFSQSKASGSGAYPLSSMLKRIAGQQNAGDALFTYYHFEHVEDDLYRRKHLLAEGASNNYAFIKKDGTIVVPRPRGTFLFGLTIQTMIYVAIELGLKVEIRDVALDELLRGDFVSAFTTGNAAGLTLVLELITSDGRIIKMKQDSDLFFMLNTSFDDFIRDPSNDDVVPFFYHNGREEISESYFSNKI
jgi:branched-subunit amino acid aminotransferase/4-amino-4-deoxychorismate lyase